jgi:iduronate 2-sulfatase
MSLNNRVRSLKHSRNMEDCRVVPPRNDTLFTLAPFVLALGKKDSCHRERSEAIFNCLFSYKSAYKPEEPVYTPELTKREIKMKTFLHVLFLLVFACSAYGSGQPNVLFIAIDDLRPELGCYGSEIAHTPNLDRLAGQGLLFERAYCQEAICSPSRASLMTGARPDTIRIIENYTYFRDINPDIVTLPQHFRAHGYETAYVGKVYHGRFTDNELSWSRRPAYKRVKVKRPSFPGGYALAKNQAIFKTNKQAMIAKYGEAAKYGLGMGPAYECADVADQAYIDGYNTDLAIATMEDMVEKGDKPFFLGYGFKNPHLNWLSPKRYWDLYDPEKIPLSTQVEGPKNGAAMGLHASFELRVRHGIPKSGPIGPELARILKHAYLASVSYVDAQIGRMLAALDKAGVRGKTIIIVWGDHGWHLGNMGIWGKATNYEIATRVPLMIWTPDMPKQHRGKSTDALVELIDMYPSLCDLARLARPGHLEGHSFAPLLLDPQRPWKQAAFSQFPNPALREWAANPLSPDMRETYFGPLIQEVETRIMAQQKDTWDRELFENHLMGYTMRTDRYRLVLWKDYRQPEAKPIFIELYDHQADPTETINIAAKEPKLVRELQSQFKTGWKGSLPRCARNDS